ncbi:MAG: transposase [Gallintestinimicrobium sp.]
MGTWKSKNRHKYLLQYHIIFGCKFGKNILFWTDGYFACSVGNVSEEMLREYIENQG